MEIWNSFRNNYKMVTFSYETMVKGNKETQM